MDVTCERCSTAYEFDDALVSERGTTVKCTNCGHQFKVRRPQPVGAPERWLVRTIDGRELEFRALRELQAAIAQALITRDDVLSRGGSRPRRLGSIAELEPFFVSAGAGGGPAHSTSLGLGPRTPIITGLPGYDGAARPQNAEGAARPRASQPGGEGGARPADRPRVTTTQGIGGVPPPRSSEVSIAIPLPRGPEPDVSVPGARRPASVPPPPRRSTPPPPPAHDAGSPPRASGGLPGIIVAPSGAPPLPSSSAIPGDARERPVDEDAFYDDTTRAERTRPRAPAPAAPPPPLDDVSGPTAPFHIGTLLDPARVRVAVQEDWKDDAGSDQGVPIAVEEEEAPAQNQHTASVPPLTPTPALRHSYADDLAEPRFSQVTSPPRRGGAARWIVGMVVVGMLVLAFATVGRKMLAPPAPAKGGESDGRIAALLADGEKSLADGDLESAKEQFDKASVLGEHDPRAGADLARLAAAKADVDWLRVRLLALDDPEQATARRELDQAATRARKAAERAGESAPTDLAVVRSRIDALRLAGDLPGARKLVGGISAAGAQPDNALTLAELDLAEAKPDWPTVLGRLRTALSTDGNLGRARSMLVYALARSGDAAGSRAELERLGALQRPHPLFNALRAYVNRTTATLDPHALPDASARPLAGRPVGAATAAPGSHEPRERPAPSEPREPRERPVPEEHVVPSGPIDTSDLPGVKAPPTPPPPTPTTAPAPPPTPTAAPAPTPTLPPGVDTSDLPGFK